MTKQELIEQLHNRTGGTQPKSQVGQTLDALGAIVREQLARGNEVTLPGIGKLTVVDRAARPGRNPATGDAITIPAKRVPHFAAAAALKEAVNE